MNTTTHKEKVSFYKLNNYHKSSPNQDIIVDCIDNNSNTIKEINDMYSHSSNGALNRWASQFEFHTLLLSEKDCKESIGLNSIYDRLLEDIKYLKADYHIKILSDVNSNKGKDNKYNILSEAICKHLSFNFE